MEKDLLIESRFRNAILYRLMEGKNNAEMARLIGIDHGRLGSLLNLKLSPMNKEGKYLKVCVDIANYFHMLPDQIFPSELYALQLPDRFLHEVSSNEVPLFAAVEQYKMLGNPEGEVYKNERHTAIASMLKTIPPRTAQIIRRRFGMDGFSPMTLEEIAKVYGLSRDRIRQIEARGLRYLRHSSRSEKLKLFLDKEER